MIVKALTVRASNEGQVREVTTTTVRGEGGKIFLTYELLGSTILRSRNAQFTKDILAPVIWAPSHLHI